MRPDGASVQPPISAACRNPSRQVRDLEHGTQCRGKIFAAPARSGTGASSLKGRKGCSLVDRHIVAICIALRSPLISKALLTLFAWLYA
jgi:hypothetical protein